MTRYAAAVVGLTGLYALALASFAPLDLLFGAILSTVLLLTSRRFVFGDRPDEEVSLLRRVVAFVPFALVVFWQVVEGTWEVALITLHLRPLRRPGIVEVPVGEDAGGSGSVGGSRGVDAGLLLRGRGPGAGERPDTPHRCKRPGGCPPPARRFLQPLPEKGVPLRVDRRCLCTK
jgi:hypothetical protein